ncbi:MAG TPA: hypothetical protein VFO39_06105 [Candidatus Sulfotelmatobacter sp.]|nr:hypothetical protein [Candidatus Sulfotelmatobacter sp.]
MATYVATDPASVVREIFREVREIEQVYLSHDGNRGVSALIIIDGKDYAVLNRIFQQEQIIIDAVPGMPINFDVVIRDGRPLAEVVTPHGRPLFQR